MDYQLAYNRLIDKYRGERLTGYVETHHIIPRCMGGSDNSDNLVRLTAKAHFVAHLLLAKIHGGKLAVAAWRMSTLRKYTSRKYEWVRIAAAEFVGDMNRGRKQSPEAKRKQIEAQSGERNPFYGRKHTEESRRKMSAAQTGKPSMFGIKQSRRNFEKEIAGFAWQAEISRTEKKAVRVLQGTPFTYEGKKTFSGVRANMSKGHLGNVPWNKGRPMSDHLKANLSEVRKRQWETPEYREKMLSRRSK